VKRVAAVALSAFTLVVLTAGAALAQAQDYPPEVLGGGGSVDGTGAATGGTAFTGSDVSMFAMAAVALLVIGAAAVLISRRRASSPA
jgi:hypothetical protein